jgi:hypothetical protein
VEALLLSETGQVLLIFGEVVQRNKVIVLSEIKREVDLISASLLFVRT